jgi:hypothetical protein
LEILRECQHVGLVLLDHLEGEADVRPAGDEGRREGGREGGREAGRGAA